MALSTQVPLQTSSHTALLGFSTAQENKLFSTLTNFSIFGAGHPSASCPHAKLTWLLQQRARIAAHVLQHQHNLCTSHPWAGISVTTSSPGRESFTYSSLYLLSYVLFCVSFFSPFFAVGLFKCPTIMQVHPNPGCICASCTLAKRTTNISIKYYLQNGDKDLPPHKAACFYTSLVNNSPSSLCFKWAVCITQHTNNTCQSKKYILCTWK